MVSNDCGIGRTILISVAGPTHFRTYEFLAWFIKKSLDQHTVTWILNYSVEYHGKSFCDTFFSLLSRVWKETTRFRDSLLLRLSDACQKLQEVFDGQVVAGVAVNGTPYKFNAIFHPLDIIPHNPVQMDLAKHWTMFGNTLCYRFSVDLKASDKSAGGKVSFRTFAQTVPRLTHSPFKEFTLIASRHEQAKYYFSHKSTFKTKERRDPKQKSREVKEDEDEVRERKALQQLVAKDFGYKTESRRNPTRLLNQAYHGNATQQPPLQSATSSIPAVPTVPPSVVVGTTRLRPAPVTPSRLDELLPPQNMGTRRGRPLGSKNKQKQPPVNSCATSTAQTGNRSQKK